MELQTLSIDDLLNKAAIDDTPNFKNDSHGLEQQMEFLRLELRESYQDGSVDDCVRIKTQLEILPIQIQKKKIEEAKAEIERLKTELAETQTLIQDARELRTERQRIFAKKMRDLNEAGTALEKVKFLLWRLDLEMQNHGAAIRHQESILHELIEPPAENK